MAMRLSILASLTMWAAKISLAKRDQQEGYYDNVTLNRDVGRNDYESYGINMVWDVTDTLALEGTYKKEETKQDTPPLLNTGQPRHLFCSSYGYCSPSLDEPITGDRLEVANQGFRPSGELSTRDNPFITAPLDAIEPIPLEATFDVDFYSIEGRWEINDAFQVDYLFGHWESNETIISNWDGTPELLFGTSRPANYDQDSNELRLTYDAGGRLSFVAGLYYWESNYDIDLRSWVTFNPGLPRHATRCVSILGAEYDF